MPFLAIDNTGKELIYTFDATRTDSCKYNFIELPKGTIEKILGKKMNPKGMPVELMEAK